MIPKKLHFIWVGDESKRPENCIDTWRRRNPDWEIRIWGNDSLREKEWINAAHMLEMYERELNGVADMMRWEILHAEGGVVVDADSICLRPLDDELLDCEAFACWESETARPGMIAAGYFGCCAGNAFVEKIIDDIRNEESVVDKMAWETVGPRRLTDAYQAYRYDGLKIHPSHYFIPEHFSGVVYDGPGPVYAHQLWGSTKDAYDDLYLEDFADSGLMPPQPEAACSGNGGATEAEAPKPDPRLSSLERLHDPYFVQKVKVSAELVGINRVDVFRTMCAGKRVLHIGCADWPITDPSTSLHLALEPYCTKLDGFDIHEDALAALAPYTRGRLFSRFEDITEEYDVVLIPEVMEHIPSVAEFLSTLSALKTTFFLITVPDAYSCQSRHFEYVSGSETFVEVVHPDHNCWYTPFTFSNTISKYTSWNIEKMWFFNNISLMALMTNPAQSRLM